MTPTERARLLQHYLRQVGALPFNWGGNNCCSFAAGWVRAATGFDPMEGLPATPDAPSALRLVRQLGGTLEAAWTERLGRPPVAAAYAQLGDLVLRDVEGGHGTGQAVGVCNGARVAFAGDDGIGLVPLAQCRLAWRLEEAA